MGGFEDTVRRLVFQGSVRVRGCSHLESGQPQPPSDPECSGYREEGTRTVHLRMCLDCGYVGCCDSSPARHARRHHEETGHPVIRSVEPGEDWSWCYPDRAYLTLRDA